MLSLAGLYLAWIVARRDAPWMQAAVTWLAPAYRDWNLKVLRMLMAVKVDPVVKVKFKLIGSPAVMPPGFK